MLIYGHSHNESFWWCPSAVAIDGKVEVPDVQLRHYTDSEGESRAVRKTRY
jgi:hypothetical protein